MKVHLRLRNVRSTRVLRAHVDRRVNFAFSRFGERIGKVTVRLTHTAGAGKHCRIDVNLHLKSVQAEDSDNDLFEAIDHAVQRASRSVARAFVLNG